MEDPKDNDDTAGNGDISPPQPLTWVDKWTGALARVATAVGALFTTPFTAAIGALTIIGTQALEFLRKFMPTDPFRLRVNGTTLLSEHVRIELSFLTLLIAGEVTWEMFCWSSMWSYSLTGIIWFLVSLAFTSLTFILTRMLVTMPSTKGKTERLMIARRLVSLTMVAIVLMIPTELRFFRLEIEDHIAAQEDLRFGKILKLEKEYETKTADTRTDSADVTLSGKDADVVARREVERKALIAQQTADKAEITQRLTDAREDAAREAAGKRFGGRGAGTNVAVLNRQILDIQAELDAFNASAKQERADFDAKTEEYRVGAVQAVTVAHDHVATTLDETLRGLDTMDKDALARRRGATWRLSRGLLDQWRAYVEILRAPELDENGQPVSVWMTSDQKFAAVIALMMVVYSLGVLFVRLGMTEPTRQYYNPIEQAIAGNKEMLKCVIVDARNGDAAALAALRTIAGKTPEAEEVFRSLGFDGNLEAAGWSKEKFELHDRFGAACLKADRDYREFEEKFRALCSERILHGMVYAGLDRSTLSMQAQRLWAETAQESVMALSQVERVMFTRGFRALSWPRELVQGDPRNAKPLWELDDDVLEARFGWSNPTHVIFHNAPRA